MRVIKNVDKMKYGYFKNRMIAIDDGLAFALFATGSEIYMLYSDNTEKLAESTDELIMHDGLFGIAVE